MTKSIQVNQKQKPRTLLQNWSCRRNYASKKLMISIRALKRHMAVDRDIYTSDRTDANGNIIPAVLGKNSIFSEEENQKITKAIELLEEVRENYKITHYQMRKKIQ